MKRNSILSKYDFGWRNEFLQLGSIYKIALGDLAQSIEHVGSTAIPEIASKPIIDIDIVISSYDDFREVTRRLAALGYWHNGDQEIPQREVFKRTDEFTPKTNIKRKWMNHHLYVCPEGSAELVRHITFRDYLRTHPASRREYEQLKYEIAARSAGDRKIYAAIKEAHCKPFVEEILRLAGGGRGYGRQY